MTFELIYTAALIVIMTICLIREVFEPDVIIFATLVLLALGGVVTVEDAVSGFSNTGMLTVALLFIVAAALKNTGVLNTLGDWLSQGDASLTRKLLHFLFPVSLLSAFFNNTPIVAMFIPAVRSWARKADLPVSKLMIPLSYAAILGGTCTLIGTSTTLLVHGLLIANGYPGFGFFEISRVSVPVALVALLFIIFVMRHLLPSRKETMVELGEHTREFVIEMKVEPEYRYTGHTIEQAGLRELKGLYLFQIERAGELLSFVGPREIIKSGDRLFFTGLPDTILELQQTKGLSVIQDHEFDLKHYDSDKLGIFEVVVSANSPLIGKSVKKSDFRSHYNAVILAIHRSGERILKKIGDIVLRTGDTLLILADHKFAEKWYHSKDFYLVSRKATTASKPRGYVWFSLSILGLMIVAMATGVIPILISVALAALALMISRTISMTDARNSIDWGVVIIIASAFGISKAVEQSGLDDMIADFLIGLVGNWGPVAILAAVYLLTSIYTEIITNNAAAALVFPVALSAAHQAGLEPRPFFIALAIAASASFATPIGYQTNLMVYGPGGYKFRDFIKVGLPMNLLVGILIVIMISLLYF
ncbi:MAG: SLC13 family permease [candidate division KSB1 bacterium]|nr:SLC13 family permease [candidate division KSB1 bacterium]